MQETLPDLGDGGKQKQKRPTHQACFRTLGVIRLIALCVELVLVAADRPVTRGRVHWGASLHDVTVTLENDVREPASENVTPTNALCKALCLVLHQ